MGKWINIGDLGQRTCTKVKYNFREVTGDAPFYFTADYGENNEAYWFSIWNGTIYDKNKGQVQIQYTEGIYDYVTVDNDDNVWWEWSNPVYFYGYNNIQGDYNNMDVLVWVEDDTEGGDTETDTETITSHLQRIIQAKADIKSALLAKGCDVGNGTIDTYAAIISNWTPS